MVIDFLNKLGHWIDYNTTCKIETSQAVKVQKLANISSILPLLPSGDNDTLDTYFWVDNFDHIVEKVAGGGAVNTTHLMAFKRQTRMEKSMSRKSVSPELENVLSNMVKNIDSCPKRWTQKLSRDKLDTINKQNFTQDTKLRRMYSVWIWLRQHYGLSDYNSKNNQTVQSFAGN